MQRVLIIENKKSGQGNHKLHEFRDLMMAKGINVVERELSRETTPHALTADADTFEAVVAAGGDGTISCVAHALAGKRIPLLAFPAGTANLIALNLGIQDHAENLFDLLEHGETSQIDLAELDIAGKKYGFTMLAGVGLDAEMIHASEELKPTLGVAAYLVAMLQNLSVIEAEITLEMEGRTIQTRGMSVMVANFGMATFGLPIAADIDPSDGLLTVIVLKGRGALSLVPSIFENIKKHFKLGEVDYGDWIQTYHCREVTIHTDPPLPIQYDGEVVEDAHTPVHARVLPRAVRMIRVRARNEMST
ncbi:diacylglycerol/lipid kinase family protein [Deinococcus cellulosilyticus]|uniref:Diacylglycerol kinase n=1 Tax=Deinococcus cellulosilyticus (strain DSM 18568 / NBRC 106333 / KACC 11606 / 5516J-15) TaxID=1223518 RepID=A0A511NBA0_DEIC1|nr:diacylglycerol kinase family protein [Deinococcus cellulosilyticus]GEM50095.1 diacylglycerol kinase [Deinococcus cellulosilyticus NBRC 106333 = KACC 11606]